MTFEGMPNPDTAGEDPDASSPEVPSDDAAGWSRCPAVLSACYDGWVELGTGNFGTVYQARNRRTGDLVAVKQLHFEEEGSGIPGHIIREVSLLQSFEHPNVVKLLDVHMDESDYYLVFEHVDIDLHKVLRELRNSNQLMPLDEVLRHSQQLVNGIDACHVRMVIHRDLKPQNILVSASGLKICDFGLARSFAPALVPYTLEVVTLWYRAPELLLGTDLYGPNVDMWSVGCCIGEMATGRALFPGDSEIGTLFLICRLCGSPTEETWPGLSQTKHWKATFPIWPSDLESALLSKRQELERDAIDLLSGLLTMCPSRRLTARRARNHAFLSGVGSAQASRRRAEGINPSR